MTGRSGTGKAAPPPASSSTSTPSSSSTATGDLDVRIHDVEEKIKKERMVLHGATRMLAVQTQPSARQMVEISVAEAQRRIEFLEGELRKLQLKKDPSSSNSPTVANTNNSLVGASPSHPTNHAAPQTQKSVSIGPNVTILGGSNSSSTSSLGGPDDTSAAQSANTASTTETRFDYVRYGTSITTDKVKFRLKEIQSKLDIEQKVRVGTENMMSALGSAIESDPRRKLELEQQLTDSKAKESLLLKAKNKFSQLYVAEDDDADESNTLVDNAQRKTGKLSMRIIGASNMTGRKSLREEIVATVIIDGILKHTTRPTRQKWDELVDITIDRALDVEINVHERGGSLLALCWFKVQDLEEHLISRYGSGRPPNADASQEIWLETEPSGQLLVKLNYMAVQRSKTERDRVFRRNPVQKVYPRNGHRFLAQQINLGMQCALCSEFLGRQGYQCQSCSYLVHARCYNRVITKCIPLDEMFNTEDKNTGQLLKYKIPHRWENVTSLTPTWCSHCGQFLNPGKKIVRCSECSKSSHKECSAMVPFFCGLAPDMADKLRLAFEEHEKKLIQKEMEDADKARRSAAPVYDVADLQPLPGVDQTGEITPEKLVPSEPQTQEKVQHQPELPQTSDSPVLASAIVAVPMSTDDVLANKPAPPQPPRASVPSQQSSRPSATSVNQVASSAASDAPPPVPPKTASRDVTIDDFHFVAVLGRGAFGKVMLATEKTTNQTYAIKALKKEFIIQNDDVKSTRLEKSIFQAASAEHHPFMVNLHSTFQSDSRIYFVMEYVSGGDLMCHIQDKKRFSQARTRFYACEVLLAVQYFHQNNIIYRDLKLDNILLGADGHIKVADYGICKSNMPYGATTSTFCGTPDYMAPEILMNRRYGLAVDWWSFGVLIFVMLVGRYPFHGEDENDILEAILADAIDYPANMPRVTLSLLQSLMNKVPSRRLGGGSADAEEVKKHPYFANVDWDAIMRKESPPPFVPSIKDPYDVSNFDKEFTSEQAVLTPITSALSDGEQREFSDFQYIADWAFQERVAAACAAAP